MKNIIQELVSDRFFSLKLCFENQFLAYLWTRGKYRNKGCRELQLHESLKDLLMQDYTVYGMQVRIVQADFYIHAAEWV